MKNICYLVSCVGQKLETNAKAKDLYASEWFKKARRYVEGGRAPWFILSAEYGLVDPESILAPYEKTLNKMGIAARRAWATRVISQMKLTVGPCDEIVVFAGARYREFLIDYLRSAAKQVKVPMEGMRIGEQLGWLSHHVPEQRERESN